ncbi:MAG TPA: histidine phosphatase family protein [Chloroflexota bacterium]|nr:histidine phosphatase family protein [Chloroflexota bacterium]
MAPWAEDAPAAPVQLLLVRHGETQWNREGRYQGRTDVPLTPAGRAQAAALAEVLRAEPLAAVYTSPLRRAYDTARPIAAAHGLAPVVDARLMEIHQGAWEGLRPAEIERRWPALYRRWLQEPETVRLPGGETLAEVERRVLAALADLHRRWAGHTVCVVAHKVSLAVIHAAVQGAPLRAALAYLPPNASVDRVCWTANLAARVGPHDPTAR